MVLKLNRSQLGCHVRVNPICKDLFSRKHGFDAKSVHAFQVTKDYRIAVFRFFQNSVVYFPILIWECGSSTAW